MSIKVWTAYRTKPGVDIAQLVHDIRVKAHKNMAKLLVAEYKRLVSGAANDKQFRDVIFNTLGMPIKPDSRVSFSNISQYVRKMYGDQLNKSSKDWFDLDTAVVFRKVGNRWILVPYPGSGFLRTSLDFLKRDKRLDDYHYQDQSDKSAKCSDKAWKARGKVWDKLLDLDGPGLFWDKLALELMSFTGFYAVDPWLYLARENAKSRKGDK